MSQGLSDPPVVVLGAGIVGVCVAAYLQRAGYKVVLMDRAEPGEGASFGNAGCINGSSIVPVAMPGVLKNVPKWLLDADGPLVMHWRHLPRMAPWLFRFVASSEMAKVTAQARALRALVGTSLQDYAPLVSGACLQDLMLTRGHLVAYSSESAYRGDALAMQLREDNGVTVEDIGQARLREIEPDLSPSFLRARRIAETGHVSDPGQFTKRLASSFMAGGGRIIRADIRGLQTDGARVSGVFTEQGLQPVASVVIALGAWSATLTRQLGDKVLLDTERGYHIEVPGAMAGPRLPTLWSEAKMFATPMAGRVRCAGTVEFAGLLAPPDWRRTALLARQLGAMYPALDASIRDHADELPRWMGRRPSTPDSLPVIGPATRFANALYAFGHGHIGLTAAASTGKALAALMGNDRTAQLDLRPFSISRFQ